MTNQFKLQLYGNLLAMPFWDENQLQFPGSKQKNKSHNFHLSKGYIIVTKKDHPKFGLISKFEFQGYAKVGFVFNENQLTKKK